MSDTAQAERVDRHEREIGEIKTELTHLHSSVDDIKSSLGRQSSKMDEVISVLNRRDHHTWSDIRDGMAVIALAGSIIAAVVGGILYVAGGAQAPAIEKLKSQVDQKADRITVLRLQDSVDRILGSTSWRAEFKASN